MANLVVVDDAFASAQAALLAVGRQTLPVRIVDSATLAADWATVLAVGATTGPTDPIIATGQQITFDGVGAIGGSSGLMEISATSSLTIIVASNPRMVVGSTSIQLGVPNLAWLSSAGSPLITQFGTSGQTMTIRAQPGSASPGGDLVLQPGNGLGVDGAVRIQSAGSDDLITATVNTTPLATPIAITDSGLAFWGGAPAIQPTITGSRLANPALTSLLTALASMGLITDNTTV